MQSRRHVIHFSLVFLLANDVKEVEKTNENHEYNFNFESNKENVGQQNGTEVWQSRHKIGSEKGTYALLTDTYAHFYTNPFAGKYIFFLFRGIDERNLFLVFSFIFNFVQVLTDVSNTVNIIPKQNSKTKVRQLNSLKLCSAQLPTDAQLFDVYLIICFCLLSFFP